jgi:hypothetical protein
MGYKERGSDGKMIPINYLTGVRQMGSLVLALDPEPVVPQQIAREISFILSENR